MTPLPAPAYIVLGLLLGLLGVRCFGAWARTGGLHRLLLGVAACGFGIDAVRVFAWRSSEAALPVPAFVPCALILALFFTRAMRTWRELGEKQAGSENSSRPGFKNRTATGRGDGV